MKTLMEKEIYEQASVLRTVEKANEAALDALCEKLWAKEPSLVYFAARGTSDHASMYASYLLGVTKKIPCALALPSVVTLYESGLDLSDALVVGVSQSGKAEDVRCVMEHGRKCGAPVVSVTNDPASPMAKEADFALFCNAGEEKSVAATKTFTSQMYALALFAAKWSKNRELLEGLRRVPDAVEEMLIKVAPKIDEIIDRYRYMTEGFILARGISYPIALEGALKLQETNYVKMKGYAMSDFYHGPFAQLDNGTPVILYAADGVCLDNAKDMLARLDTVGAETILVSDNADILAGRPLSFKVPSLGSDALSPFLFAVFAQLFACKLTAVKGLNPDAPRNLKKVTVTK